MVEHDVHGDRPGRGVHDLTEELDVLQLEGGDRRQPQPGPPSAP